MKRIVTALALIASFTFSQADALATTYSFSSVDGTTRSANADMNDLAHGNYYGWSVANSDAQALGNELAKGFTIQSATLTFKNIWNWDARESDRLNSFLLSGAPPIPGKSETVPVVINGVPQGKTVYTYTKTTISTKTNTTGSVPSGYVLASKVQTGTRNGIPQYLYTFKKTTVSTKNNATGIAPAGYSLASSKFVPDMVTLGNGVKLSDNLWTRTDQENPTDIDWGVESFRIQDITGDPANPWDDPLGGRASDFDLIYELDEASLNALFEYALDGQFGIGIDPDCHYYNDGIYFTVETVQAPVPEPSTFILLGAGVAVAALMTRRKKL